MAEIGARLVQRGDAVERRHRRVAQPAWLREHKPHPMGAFPTSFQLGQNGRKHRRLGGYEALQVERIGSGQFRFPTDAVRLLVAAGLVVAASSIRVGAWSLAFS